MPYTPSSTVNLFSPGGSLCMTDAGGGIKQMPRGTREKPCKSVHSISSGLSSLKNVGAGHGAGKNGGGGVQGHTLQSALQQAPSSAL